MKIKNVRPGILIIADAGMKLAPGDSAEVDALTPQMESAAAAKVLVVTAQSRESREHKSAAKPKEEERPDTGIAGSAETAETAVGAGAADTAGAQTTLLEQTGTDSKIAETESPAAEGAEAKGDPPVAKTGGAKSGSK